jgi:DNA-binding protein HU-beta
MKKSDLINVVSGLSITEVSKTQVEAVLETLGVVVQNALKTGDEVTLPGVGKLSSGKRAARTGRNPKTGESIQIPESVVAKFSAAKALKEHLN